MMYKPFRNALFIAAITVTLVLMVITVIDNRTVMRHKQASAAETK